MSWVRLNMRFPGSCLECGKRVSVGEQAFWARGVGVKHIECAQKAEAKDPYISCLICGKPAGCERCELADSCNTKKVSPHCICSRCNVGDAMDSYTAAVVKKFPAIHGST